MWRRTMINYNDIFNSYIKQIKSEKRLRKFNEIERDPQNFPKAYRRYLGKKQRITLWCGVDYLGMGQNETVIEAMVKALRKVGSSSGGSRNIGGNSHYHVELEWELARLHERSKAILFNSGYVANQATLSALGKIIPDCIFLSDAENHASIIEGIKLSKRPVKIFKHNDVSDLESHLADLPLSLPKIVVFESLYSMAGDIAPIKKIIEVSKKYNALTYVDEVHAVGAYGKNGGGITEAEGLQNDVTLIQGTIGKSFGLCGGYVAGDSHILEAIKSCASGFIFTVSLPPAISAGALASLKYLRNNLQEKERLHENALFLRNQLKELGFNILNSESFIIPIHIGDAEMCSQISKELLDQWGIYIQPVNFPSVQRGNELLRISVSSRHTVADMQKLLTALSATILNRTMKKYCYIIPKGGARALSKYEDGLNAS